MRAILTYHAIDDVPSPVSLPPADLARHVAWLASGRVAVVGLDELLILPATTDAVAVTFDDARSSVATEAAPRLADAGLTATLFVPTDHVGGDTAWGGKPRAGRLVERILDWEALARLQGAGWTIGSHTRRHPRLTQCTDAELDDELAGSRQQLEARLGQRPLAFAYPYGDVDARVESAVSRHYTLAVGTDHQLLDDSASRHRLPRLDAWYFRGPAPFRDWGSAAFRRRVAWRHALRRLRRAWR